MAQTNILAQDLLSSPLKWEPTLRRVLRAIWKSGAIPRIELAAELDLDKSTITKVVSSLIEDGLVAEGEAGAAGPSGGRKPVELRIRKDFGSFLGMEIQTERCQACLIDPEGGIISSHSAALSFSGRPLRSVVLDAIAEIRGSIPASAPPLLGIGLGLSGIIDSNAGIVRRSFPLGIAEAVDLGASVGDLLSVPLRIENDARCCCWSELVRRRASEPEDFLFILGEFRKEEAMGAVAAGVAVGIAIVMNGMVHRGLDGTAGEFRSVFRSSPTKSQFSLPDGLIARAATDPEAFGAVADELGLNVGLLVNMLDLRKVVVGGAFERFREVLGPRICAGIASNTPYPGQARCDISYSDLGEKVVAYGAAAMLANRLFAEPARDPAMRRRAQRS